MKCPKCNFTTFDNYNFCSKCNTDLSNYKKLLNIISFELTNNNNYLIPDKTIKKKLNVKVKEEKPEAPKLDANITTLLETNNSNSNSNKDNEEISLEDIDLDNLLETNKGE